MRDFYGTSVQTVHGVAAAVGVDLLLPHLRIDAVLDASPAAYIRHPPVSSESPTLGRYSLVGRLAQRR